MRIFGFEITRASKEKALQQVSPRGDGWYPVIREPFAGAWQRNMELRDIPSITSFTADFACRTLIAGDVAKCRVKLVKRDDSGIWSETTNPAYSPVLRKPNGYQTRVQFFESWMLSKLGSGNAYVLKQRDGRGVVVALYVLDPNRVTVLLADDGSVFYRLQSEKLAGLPSDVVVPAREIIHDRFNTQWNQMVGVSPITAHALQTTLGINIQTEQALLYQNNAMPSGLLVAPDRIGADDAARMRQQWYDSFGGVNRGKVAVVGNGVKFEKIPYNAVEGEVIAQLKWTAENVCSAYHVPAFMVLTGAEPNYNNVQSLTLRYYSQCVQVHFEHIEACLDEGLGMADGLGVEFDTENLIRMDSVTQMEVLEKSKGILTPNEQRAKLDKGPKQGGDSPMLQQQNFSLEALAKRDSQADPFATAAPAAQGPANDNMAAALDAALRRKGQKRFKHYGN